MGDAESAGPIKNYATRLCRSAQTPTREGGEASKHSGRLGGLLTVPLLVQHRSYSYSEGKGHSAGRLEPVH